MQEPSLDVEQLSMHTYDCRDKPGPRTKEVEMLAVLFLVLLTTCIAAPFFGTDTSDARSEAARPEQGWFPAG
jgi:hypothetical protein